MASIGTANLTIVPKFDGLTASVNRALAGVDASAGGQRMGRGLSEGVERGTSGLSRQGAIIGVFSTVTSKAMDAIASHVGSAASRLDTLKNYPVTMQALGYSAEASQASIQTMSDRLGSLPTRLDDMARTVQGLVSVTGDLGKATDVGLAMNDMFLASGASTQLATAAGEQFRQMLSKGKPDMQDWKSLVSAAPGQMDQLAKAMLGPTAGANDLYAALGGGKNEATVSMDQLLDKIVELDQRGGEGITSFREQAETASGGIQTSFENMGNAVTKGIANVMDAVGRDAIAGVLNDVKGGINDAFRGVADVARDLAPALKGAWDVAKRLAGDLKPLAPAIAAIATAAVGLKAARGAFGAVSADMGALGKVLSTVSGGIMTVGDSAVMAMAQAGGLGAKLAGPVSTAAVGASGALSSVAGVLSGPWGVAIAAGVAGVGLLVGHLMEAQQRQEAFTSAVDAFNQAAIGSSSLGVYHGEVEGIGQAAVDTTVDIDGLTEKIQSHADAMARNNESAQTTIGTWQTVQSTIDGLIGKTDLTTEEQGRLKWALDQVNEATGLSISQEDVLTGKYQDQNGEAQDLRGAIDDLAQAKINEARANALQENLTEAYKAQSDALDEYAKAQKNYNDRVDEYVQKYGMTHEQAVAAMGDNEQAKRDLDAASAAYESATQRVSSLSSELGNSAAASDEAADAYARLAADQAVSKAFETAGQDVSKFAGDLRDMGMSTDDFADMSMESLTRLAAGYDGSKASIVAALQGMGDEGRTALSHMGADYAAMVEQCGGDTQLLTSMIEVYNSTPVLDKEGNVTMDTAELLDANGNVIEWNNGQLTPKDSSATVDYSTLYDANMNALTWDGQQLVPKETTASAEYATLSDGNGQIFLWNGSSLVDQSGQAVVDDVTLVDGQKNIWQWNGSRLVPQNGRADVDSSTVERAISDIGTYNSNAPQNFHATTTIDVIHNTFENIIRTVTGGAWGGVRIGGAWGGVARGHARGSLVVNSPGSGVPIDVVGEAGPEAIVPLTSRYSAPFVRDIAEQVAKVAGLGGGATYVVNVDGATLNDDARMREVTIDFLEELQRRAAMNVG